MTGKEFDWQQVITGYQVVIHESLANEHAVTYH